MKSPSAESSQNNHVADHALQSDIATARTRSLAWLAGMQAPDAPTGVLRIGAAHDPRRWPGMLLPGTYNGTMARALLGDLPAPGGTDNAALVRWLLAQRRPDGVFRIQGMHDDTVFKKPDLAETWGYIDFHVTNYSLGAVACLEPGERPELAFARRFLDTMTLKAWLADRDMRDPWLEGNNIVNLGSFLLLMLQHGATSDHETVRAALKVLFDWHDRLQEPSTGFWGVGQHADPLRLLHAMAGSMHNYHLWYATGRSLPYQARAVDYCLTQPPRIHSACIDVDLVDLLVHASWQIDHRRGEIHQWLRALLPELLAFQNADGGFCDVRDGPGVPPRRQDGWVKGFEEPQGLSNTFATWFRWIAIAMVCECLWPGWSPIGQCWRFREMVGIGYCQPRHMRSIAE
jgi:hypothetical protein